MQMKVTCHLYGVALTDMKFLLIVRMDRKHNILHLISSWDLN